MLATSFLGSETILLVEDEEAVRRLIRRCLKSNGYNVLEAKDGVEALAIAERHKGPIHLLLTDVVMSPIHGRALARCLTPLRPQMKVLYISGHTEDDIVRHSVLEQGAAFVPKPFATEALLGKVREVLDAPQTPSNATSSGGP